MKCSNVVECMCLLVCVLCQPVPPSIQLSLHLVDSFFRKLFKFLVSALFLLSGAAHTCGWCVIRARALANGVYQLIHSDPMIEKHFMELCHSYVQNQVQNVHPQRNSWLLVAVSNATYSYHVTALGWSRWRKKMMNNSDFQPLDGTNNVLQFLCIIYQKQVSIKRFLKEI